MLSSSSPFWSYLSPSLLFFLPQNQNRKQKEECKKNRRKTIPHLPPSLPPSLSLSKTQTQAPREIDVFDFSSSQWKLPSKRFSAIYLSLLYIYIYIDLLPPYNKAENIDLKKKILLYLLFFLLSFSLLPFSIYMLCICSLICTYKEERQWLMKLHSL